MSQFELFGGNSNVLFDGPTGTVAYHPNCVAAAQAERWFELLRAGIEWQSERRMMYEREVDVPRLVGGFRLDDPLLPAAIAEAAAAVAQVTGMQFSSAGLNYYRDGSDSVAPHNDRLQELMPGFPIALLSLGATRRMTIRAKAPPRHVRHIDLEAGSVLIMDYESQKHFDHGIPKSRAAVGPRISVAFRRRRL